MTLSACGGSSSSTSSSTAASASASGSTSTTSAGAPSASLRSLVPATVAKTGVLDVGSTVGYPPSSFLGSNNSSVVGFDPDIASAMATELGLRSKVTNTAFSGLVPGLLAKRYNIIMSELADTKAREQSGVDFVDYFDSYAAILVKHGNPQHITALTDLCGKTVAVETGAIEDQLVQSVSSKCGKHITILTFPTDAAAQLQVSSGRAAADVNDSAELGYVAKSVDGGSAFQIADYSPHADVGPSGIAIPKSDPALVNAIHHALLRIIANGAYAKILKKWGVESSAIKKVTINGATS
jgi:polar amino acid transport system substrate-binding protein